MLDKEYYHRILGHVNFNDLSRMCKRNYLEGLPENLENVFMECQICLESKLSNLAYNRRTRARYCGQIIHSDVKYLDVIGYRGENYFVTFIDDYSRIAKVYCIKQKSEVYEKFVEYFNLISNIVQGPICELRCDNGKEYLNKNFYEFARNNGFRIAPCIAYNHQQNGVAERYNQTIMNRVRCLRKEANLEKKFWPEIVDTACYIGNRVMNSSTYENKTPYEIFCGIRPTVKNLKMYGADVYVRIPDEKRTTSDDKAKKGKLVGYHELGYRVLVNGQVELARNVHIVEPESYTITAEDENDESSKKTKSTELSEGESKLDPVGDRQGDFSARPKRKVEPPTWHQDYVIQCKYVSTVCPESFREAVESDDAGKWKQAMKKEFDSLNQSKTWQLIKRPENKPVLNTKWVYRVKSNDLHKARLVVKGYEQIDCQETIYAPVAKMATLRSLLAMSCSKGYEIHHLDVQTAFLNSPVKSEIYVEQPEGCKIGSNDDVYRLKRSLYGLKESPRNWYDHFNEFIVGLGFRRSNYDPCMYINDKCHVFCIIFVDDVLLSGENAQIRRVKDLFLKRFQMTDFGKVSCYLGIEIKFKENEKELTLSQKRYIEDLAYKYNVETANVKYTPMEQNLKLVKGEPNESLNYRNLIGALLYIAQGTRPDINFSVNYLSRFQNCSTREHFKLAERILIYLFHTRDKVLNYRCNGEDLLDSYVDSDWANDDDCKSTTGFVIRIFGNPITWKIIKQKNVARASTHAEYYAIADALQELIFIKGVISDFNVDKNLLLKTKVYEDNTGAIALANNGIFTKRSKHIDVAYHFVHDLVVRNEYSIVQVRSDKNIADVFTKALGRVKFEYFCQLLNVY